MPISGVNRLALSNLTKSGLAKGKSLVDSLVSAFNPKNVNKKKK